MSNLTVQIDTAEPRIQYDRLGVVTTGSRQARDGNLNRVQWDMVAGPVGGWLDFITFTGFLLPAPATAAWQTNARAPYLIRKADTDRASSANWIEHQSRFDGNYYLHSLGVNEAVTVLGSFEKNMP